MHAGAKTSLLGAAGFTPSGSPLQQLRQREQRLRALREAAAVGQHTQCNSAPLSPSAAAPRPRPSASTQPRAMAPGLQRRPTSPSRLHSSAALFDAAREGRSVNQVHKDPCQAVHIP